MKSHDRTCMTWYNSEHNLDFLIWSSNLDYKIIEWNPKIHSFDSESALFPIPKITDSHSALPKILVRNHEPLHLSLEAGHLLGALSSKNLPLESLKTVENLRSWFQAVFFPQDFSCCLEFVMQICSKSTPRSFSKENVFDEIYFPWSDVIF